MVKFLVDYFAATLVYIQEHPFLALLEAILGLVIGIRLNRWLYKKLDIELVVNYTFDQLRQLYFCSYDLLQVHLSEFFPRYNKFTDWGFCCPVAGLNMLAMKNNRTARFVLAMADKNQPRWHCWVEFRYRGVWYVLDPCWYFPFLIKRRAYYKANAPKIIEICNYKRFWNYEVSRQLYEKMLHPETSWVIAEIIAVYSVGEKHPTKLFTREIEEVKLDESSGKHIHAWIFISQPQILVSRRLIHDMMSNPKRTRPKAHHIRRAKFAQKKILQNYEQFLDEHPDIKAKRDAELQAIRAERAAKTKTA